MGKPDLRSVGESIAGTFEDREKVGKLRVQYDPVNICLIGSSAKLSIDDVLEPTMTPSIAGC